MTKLLPSALRPFAYALAALAMALATAGAYAQSAASHVEIDGVPFEDTAVVNGVKLVLNGVTIHKRGYFKTEAVGLYLPQKAQTPDSVVRMHGPKRLRLIMMRDAPGALISRFFVMDFKRWATDEEFKLLINEVGQVGGLYANVKSLSKGDEVLLDWIPGEGLVSHVNGKLSGPPVKSELFFNITCLRPSMSPDAPQEDQKRLLGIIAMPTAPGPYPVTALAEAKR